MSKAAQQTLNALEDAEQDAPRPARLANFEAALANALAKGYALFVCNRVTYYVRDCA